MRLLYMYVFFPKDRNLSPDTLILHLTQEMLRSAIDGLNLVQFLPMLLVLEQDEHISTPLDCDHPKFYWIFKNLDFKQWSRAKCSRVLRLSGPPECDIHQVSSYIACQEKNREHLVLYFFCSPEITRGSTAVHTILNQIVHCSPMDKRILIVRRFLHSLLEQTFQKEEALSWKQRGFREEDSPDTSIRKILEAPIVELWTALGAVLSCEQGRELSIIVDGLEHIQHQRAKFITGVRSFVEHLQQRTSEVKILLTSRPLPEIKDLLNGLPFIEYDKERKGSPASHVPTLYQN